MKKFRISSSFLLFTVFALMFDSTFAASSTVTSTATGHYVFGKTSFKSYVWVNGGSYFKNPSLVCVELGSNSNIFVEYHDSNGYYDGEYLPGPNWQCAYPSLTGNYKIKLKNADTGNTVNIVGGEVNYEK
ncbi:hypothetical protein FB479_105187 [Brevibacillus sp. AG162]|nr:hypothetical protein FB479_105187 [Brevibacillus sp. AG162]